MNLIMRGSIVKKRPIVLAFILMVLVISIQAFKKKDDLPDQHKKWLKKEVVYIITPLEKEVFLKLKTNRERNFFIEAFWKHRDPTEGNERNEFKKEHYRRLNYANHFFSRGIPKPGWRTDRGRIYIILGEPNDIQRFEGASQVYPTEVWFYQGKTDIGLAPGFHVVFFKERGIGDYKLYSPVQHGPQALLISYYGDPTDYLAAYRDLEIVEPTLASVSLTLIPGGRLMVGGRPSMSSDILLQKIESSPLKLVKDKYAQKFLEYKDIVEVEYSTNYIASESLVKVIKDPSGIYFVHYSIGPERFSVNQYQNKYYTTLKLNGKVSDLNGKTIYQFEKSISLDFDEEQMEKVTHRPLNIRDMFPLIPGNFQMSVLLKNEVSKEFTSLERNIIIPGDEDNLQMTSLILGYNITRDTSKEKRLRPFQLGEFRIDFQANQIFRNQDDMVVGFQLLGLDEDMREKGEINYMFLKNNQQFRSFSNQINDFTDVPNFVEIFSLKEFLPAHYSLKVSLFLDGKEVIVEEEKFDITHIQAIPRPWIYTKLLTGPDNPVHLFVLGIQFLNYGKFDKARVNFEKARKGKPDSSEIAIRLAQTYLALKEYKKVESVLLPFLNQPEPTIYEVYLIIGKVYQIQGEFSKAIKVFDKAIAYYGLNTNILNALGESYFQLGELDKALAAWEKSLELYQAQPQIKEYVDSIKEKK